MIQGTGSHVGKSVLVAALCRILHQDGYRVAPFKSQNMALNSFVTSEGGEMGRAQAVQAQAAGIEPHTDMNPILLKPTADQSAQVIIQGRPVDNMSAVRYHRDYVKMVWPVIETSFARLQDQYEIIILEGAGSPAEINLRDDIVNMRSAHLARAKVLLVADIDRGGALADVIGTMELLPAIDRELIAGIIFNKFRGDKEFLQPALDFLENRLSLPVLGVIPYAQIDIPEEDSVNYEIRRRKSKTDTIEIVVLYLPHISNFTDFDALEKEPDVALRYVRAGDRIGRPDCLIIPGSKNTIADLDWMRQIGWDRETVKLAGAGVPVVGICGGYQMLGRSIMDVQGVESPLVQTAGLGLLETDTYFSPEKTTCQVSGEWIGLGGIWEGMSGIEVRGYEIHMGQSQRSPETRPVLKLSRVDLAGSPVLDGAASPTGLVWGTYLHGLFDGDEFRRSFLNRLRLFKGWAPLSGQTMMLEHAQNAFDQLADMVRQNIELDQIYTLLGLE